jgi:hypothetical protein
MLVDLHAVLAASLHTRIADHQNNATKPHTGCLSIFTCLSSRYALQVRLAKHIIVMEHDRPLANRVSESTMALLQQYQLARVVQLRYPLDTYDGWRVNRRRPAIGDMGTIVEIIHAPGLSNKYVVESSDADGITIWLADFDAEELAPIDDA